MNRTILYTVLAATLATTAAHAQSAQPLERMLEDASRVDTTDAYLEVIARAPAGGVAKRAYALANDVATRSLKITSGRKGVRAITNAAAHPMIINGQLVAAAERLEVTAALPLKQLAVVLPEAAEAYRHIEAERDAVAAERFLRSYPHSPLTVFVRQRMAGWAADARETRFKAVALTHALTKPHSRAYPNPYELTARNTSDRPLQSTLQLEQKTRLVTLEAGQSRQLVAQTAPGAKPRYSLAQVSETVGQLPALLVPKHGGDSRYIRVELSDDGAHFGVRIGDGPRQVHSLHEAVAEDESGRRLELGGLRWSNGRWERRGTEFMYVTQDQLVDRFVGPTAHIEESGKCSTRAAMDRDAAWRSRVLEQHALDAADRRRWSAAAKLAVEAVTEDPGNLSAIYNAACLRSMAGAHEAAVRWLVVLSRRCEPEAAELLLRAHTDPDLTAARKHLVFQIVTADRR